MRYLAEELKKPYRRWGAMGARLFLLCVIAPPLANAQTPASPTDATKKAAKAEKPVTYTSAIVVEPETGTILFEKDAHTPLPPASMVKMMTALIVMEKVRDGALKLDEKVTASRWAAQMGGSQVYLKEGEVLTVEELLKAMMIHSANDATAALAEHVAGHSEAFVDLMNQRAESLGLKETKYHSVHGLPAEPGQEDDVMSAADLATLGREIVKFPKIVEFVAKIQEPFRDGAFTLVNPNHLLRTFPGADGIKTGFHNKAGFCVTGSAMRGDLRLLVVVMGSTTKSDCFKNAAQLLNQGFATNRMLVPVKGQVVLEGKDVKVRGGVVGTVPIAAKQDVKILVKKGEEKKVKVTVNVLDRVGAPIAVGQAVGEIVVTFDGAEVGKTQALAVNEVQSTWWWRFWPF
ncbi:MAG: D-alanyl-D-alanine carboxypeptidase [Deltaproteobacteria bacterium]|nr:D-alanyl-D-alanine carboxypeptidase [Deltaproteobacteria bacterium]